MKDLKNAKRVLLELAQRLCQDEKLLQLTLDDTPDLKVKIPPQYKTFDYLIKNNYISLYPIVSTNIKDIVRNTFLVLVVDEISFDNSDSSSQLSGAIYVTTDQTHHLLSGCKDRRLEMADLICQDLDQLKISATGEVKINTINSVVVDEFRAGYRISFSTYDIPTQEVEI